MTKYARKNQLNYAEMQRNKEQIVSGEEEKQNSIKTQSQSGRSMIEMLGVLAIIAILSIGGIVGYKLAMNYYQADQIANEINLMRNDLKVKYALGNEELLLGDPYDDTPENEDYSGHLSTQYDRYPVDYDCIIRGNKESKNELYNCREADAYYIVVGNISKGVCKPLTTLVAAMDGRLEMDINGLSYTGGDSCTSDENNEIYVEFDAADVNGNYDSNRPEGWCAKDEDCEESQVCDKESNTCVECVGDGNCSAPRSVCDVANHECVECIEHTDCKDSSRPRCNDELGNCESCPPEKPIWLNGECVECTANAQCLERGKDPYCNKETYRCESCPDGGTYEEEHNACVIHIPTEFFLDGAFAWENLEKAQPKCKKITPNHFGPYEHSYKIWGHGTMDDCIELHVNSDPDTSDVTQCTTGFRAQKCCCGEGQCRGYCSDFPLGELNAGEYGNLVVYDATSYHSWGMSWVDKQDGNPPRNDGDIWLILKEE